MPHHNRARTETDSGGQLARGLGWFSLGLGLAEVTAPGTMARLIGIPEEDEASASMLRALGAREIAHGVSILMRADSAPRLWARVHTSRARPPQARSPTSSSHPKTSVLRTFASG